MPTYLASIERPMPSAASPCSPSLPSLPLNGFVGQDMSPTDGTLPIYLRKGIHSLPHEVMSRIFILGANENYPYADSPFLLKQDGLHNATPTCGFQIKVSHVCSRWRRIALETPGLWNMVYFKSPSDVDRGKEFIGRCEARSISYPLDIFIETVAQHEYDSSNLYTEELKDIFAWIKPRIGMWRSFHLKVRCDECKLLARDCLSTCGGAPLMETLQLYHFEDFRSPDDLHHMTYRRPVVCFANALPKLKNVSMIGVNLPWDDSPYVHKLHHLELALHRPMVRPAYKDWVHMVLKSPELRSLALNYSGPLPEGHEPDMLKGRNEWPTTNERTALEQLEYLDLNDLDTPEYLCRFMSYLIFPALKRLSICLPDQDYDYTPFLRLAAGLENAGSIAGASYRLNSPFPSLENLQELRLLSLTCDKAVLKGFLLHLNGLRTLEVLFANVPYLFDLLLQGVPVQVPLLEDNDTRNRGNNGALNPVGTLSGSRADVGGGGYNAAHLSTSASVTPDNANGTCTKTRSAPLLPRLQKIKLSGLSGSEVFRLIRSRDEAGLRLPVHREENDHEQEKTTYRINHWIIGWNENMSDPLLKDIVQNGLPGVKTEHYDNTAEEEEEEEEEDYEGEEEHDEGEDGDEYADEDGEGEDLPDDTESSAST